MMSKLPINALISPLSHYDYGESKQYFLPLRFVLTRMQLT